MLNNVVVKHTKTYFYCLFTQNRNFTKVRHGPPDDGPGGP